MPKAITPVNVTPALTGWQDVDITAHVGSDSGNVRGAILHIANQTGSTQAFGVRPKGATTTRTRNMANGWQAYQVVLVDGDDLFQVNCGSTSLEVYLIGYLLADEYNGLVNEVEITPTEDGTYRTVDIGAHVGSDTPIGAVLAIDNGCGSTHPNAYVRAVGSTDDYYRPVRAQTNTLAIVKLDASKQFEAKVGGGCTNIFLLGWITANANFVTNLTLHGVSAAGTYETIDLSSEVDADAVGVWWFREPGDNFPGDTETVKEAGSAYGDEFYLGIDAPAWGFTKLSALKRIEYRSADIDNTTTIAVVADAVEGGGGSAFDESIALGASAGLTASGGLDMDAAVSLAASLGLTAAPAVVVPVALSLGASSGLAAAGGLDAVATLALPVIGGLSPAGTLAMDAAAAFGASADLEARGGTDFQEALAFPVAPGVGLTGAHTLGAALTLAAEAGLTSSSVLDAVAALTLATEAGSGFTGTLVLDASISVAAAAGLETRGGSAFEAALTIGASPGMAAQATLTAVGSLSLPAGVAAQLAARMDAGGSIAVGAVVELTLAGQGVSFGAPATLVISDAALTRLVAGDRVVTALAIDDSLVTLLTTDMTVAN